MPVKILIPPPYRSLTDKQEMVMMEGGTVGELLQHLTETYPGLKKRMYTPKGKLKTLVTVCLNNEDVRQLERENTPVTESDTVTILGEPKK